MAFGPKAETLTDRDINRASKIGLTNLYDAQAETMLAGAEQTRYKTDELRRTEDLRTETKEFELEAAKLQKDKFEIMLNEFKASEPSRRAMEKLGILKNETEALQVQALQDFITKHPEKSLTWITREIEKATYDKDVRAIHTRDMTMYKMGDQIVELMNQGRMTEANQLYEVAKNQYFEIEGKPLVDELDLPEILNSDHISLLKSHVESAKMGTEWAEFALQREKDAAAIEAARVTGESAADKQLKLKETELKIAERYQNIESKDLANVQAASKAMTTAMAQIQAANYGAVEAADGGIKSNSPHYGQHTTVNSAMAEAFEDLYKEGNRLSASEVSRQFWSDWTFDEDATRPSKWIKDDPMYVPRDEERKNAYMIGLDQFIAEQRAKGDESNIEELIQNYLAQEMQGYKKGIIQRFNRAIK